MTTAIPDKIPISELPRPFAILIDSQWREYDTWLREQLPYESPSQFAQFWILPLSEKIEAIKFFRNALITSAESKAEIDSANQA